ncbi:MAG: EAL domain-containing protein [Gammaproteobacteria bacterium]
MLTSSDTLWLITATFLVLLMQCGFLLLEGGRVRSKNSINVAQKNVSDIIVSWAVFMTIGFYVMFGIAPPLGNGDDALSPLHFLFQLGFCATAASIISGGVAERMSFRAYLMLTVIVAACIYPVAGRLVWGSLFEPDTHAWLAHIGFIDFAGATVVHGVGAACALASIIVIGPRHGRFDSDGRPVRFPAYNSVLALTGVMILLFGWLGFNGGGLSASDPTLPGVLMNTMTAAAFGGLAGLISGNWFDKGVFRPDRTSNGILGGLVAITASAGMASATDAMIVGTVGGLVGNFGAHFLLHRCRIDDPIDVVATHGLAGFFGTLSVAFVAPESTLPAGSRLAQFAVQAFGSACILSLAFVVTYVALRLFGRFEPVRVSLHSEELGLNYAEHGEAVGTERLQRVLESKIRQFDDDSADIELESDDEHSELASVMTRLMDKYEDARGHLDQSNERFRQFAKTASDWLFETNVDLEVTYISGSVNPDDRSQLKTGVSVIELLHLEDPELTHVLKRFTSKKPSEEFESRVDFYGPEGDETLVAARAVPFYDDEGNFKGYRGTISDITQRKAAQTKALYLAIHDDLTGLPNRRALTTQLPGILAAADREEKHVVVAGIDLDGFKTVNDTNGHTYGDKVLMEVADRMRAVQREQDHAYRTGGDEFVMVMPGFAPTQAVRKATAISDRIIKELSREYEIEGRSARLGASVGISVYPQDSTGVHDIARLADLALYAAKSQGKGRVVTFEPKMDLDAKRQIELEEDLRQALKRDELFLHYQPLIDVQSKRITSIEALLRWRHPKYGLVPPLDFIPLAEKFGLIDEIGEFVLLRACEFAHELPTYPDGMEIGVAVNVSPTQLRNDNFPNVVRRCLRESELRSERLEIEITEQMVVEHVSQARETLNDLRALGIGIAVDDFGSGQTSLGYLSQFPLTKLKIDRSFIRQITNDLQASEITRSMVTLGHSLGMKVIAEGIEEQRQLELLQRWGCDQVQGYLMSPPLPVEELNMLVDIDTQQHSRSG